MALKGEAMTVAQRKAKERKAKRDAGLVPVEVWVKPCHVASIRQYAERLKVVEPPKVTTAP